MIYNFIKSIVNRNTQILVSNMIMDYSPSSKYVIARVI